jgi:signal peptidase I
MLFAPVVLVSGLWVSYATGWAARASGVRVFSIPSVSMAPFVRPGDYVLADLRYYGNRRPTQGDVVIVYRERSQPYGGIHTIKRVIGVAGDQIAMVNGTVIKNNVPLEEPYAHHDAGPPIEVWLRDMNLLVVPPSKLFLLGDNRDNSLDSRSPDVGLYDESQVQGKVIEVFHPFRAKTEVAED